MSANARVRSIVDETSPLPPHQWPTGDEDAGGPESTGSTSCPRRRAHVKKKAKPSDGSRWTLRAADGRPSSSAGARSRPRGQRRPESQPPESIPLRAWSARDLGGRFGADCRGGRSGSRSSPAAGPDGWNPQRDKAGLIPVALAGWPRREGKE